MHRAAFISNFDRDVAGCRAAPNYLPIRDGKFNRTPDGGGGLRRAHFDDLLGPGSRGSDSGGQEIMERLSARDVLLGILASR